jgi:Protein of unknown function (DUF3137)
MDYCSASQATFIRSGGIVFTQLHVRLFGMRHQELFDQVMGSGLRAWFDEQADNRKQAVAQQTRRFFFGMCAAVIAFIGIMALTPGDPMFGVFAGVMLSGAAWWYASLPVQAVSDQIKVRANEELGLALGLTYRTNELPSADFHLATQLGLLPSNPDKEDFFDFWTGRFGTSDGQLHEAHLQEYQDDGKRRTLETIFRGVIIGYQFARPFSSTTLVQADKGMFNGLANFVARFSDSPLEPVKMVHPDFENRFEVTTSDQVEARYLLHPAFCERLLETVRAFNGQNMRMAFAQGRVVIVIETKDLFESGGIDARGDEKRLATTIEQIGSLIDLTQTLNERPR